MRSRANRNILAALCIIAGAVLIAVSPVAADGDVTCVDVTVDFDSLGQGALTKNLTTLGPVDISLTAGIYNVVLTSNDPTHAPGAFTDQLNESWFLVLSNGYTSPVTPDIPDADLSLTVVVDAVSLDAATTVTAVWSGQAPSFDSVHPIVTFRCVDALVGVGTTTTTTAPSTTTLAPTTLVPVTTSAPATTSAPTTTALAASSTTTGSTASTTVATTVAVTTTDPGAVGVGVTTTVAATDTTSTTDTAITVAADTSDDADGTDNPGLGIDGELAATGVNTNLALAGAGLIVMGIALVISGAVADDRRRLATVRVG